MVGVLLQSLSIEGNTIYHHRSKSHLSLKENEIFSRDNIHYKLPKTITKLFEPRILHPSTPHALGRPPVSSEIEPGPVRKTNAIATRLPMANILNLLSINLHLNKEST